MLGHLARPTLAGLLLIISAMGANATGTLNRASPLGVRVLDPAYVTNAAEMAAVRDLYEGLTVLGPDGAVRPGVAESWTASADGLTWTFKLRPARWTDGRNVVAADFVRAFRRLADPKTASPNATLLASVAGAAEALAGKAAPDTIGVAATDMRTLEIRLDRPVPHLPLLLSHAALMPMPSTEGIAATTYLSNGPFKLADFEAGKRVRMTRNDAFHDAASVSLDTVDSRVITDPEAALAAFRAGEIDTYDGVPVYAVTKLKAELGDKLRVAPYVGTLYVALRVDNGPLTDLALRKALALSLDRAAIASKVWGDTMLPARSFVPPGMASYGEPPQLAGLADPIAVRVETAKATLAAAGYSEKKKLKLRLSIPEGEIERNTAAALAAAWEPLGVDIDVAAADPQRHYGELARGRYQMALIGWIGEEAEASAFLKLLAGGNEGQNHSAYANAEFDTLIADMAKTADGAARAKLAHAAEAVILRDLPVIPLLHYASLSLVAGRIDGWKDNAENVHLSRWLAVK